MLEEKEKTMDVIKRYVEVNDDVENETMKYLGEVWTERQRNEKESCKCGVCVKCVVTTQAP